MRRRPLLRAAAVGGAAYMAGKSRAQHQAEAGQAPAAPAQAAPAGQPGSGSAPGAPGGGGPAGGPGQAVTDQLSRLASLHQQGALTDTEFAAAKAKLLGT
ncbi:MAG TPA: SHOCT domain-containing protein [Streptosporangiaceae bacterium]|nr:SHOCT domain-containing protein [Streptosporangiaceae bacterium]